MRPILTLNAGSSSLKAAVYDGVAAALVRAEVAALGAGAIMTITAD